LILAAMTIILSCSKALEEAMAENGRNKMAENNLSLKPLRLTETVRGAG
jgi:hypothetical protein